MIGLKGPAGVNGSNGKSAYELAVDNGYKGTESEWLTSLVGKVGADGTKGQNGENGTNGKSAYELAKDNGFTGSLADWLDSVTGKDGLSAYELAKRMAIQVPKPNGLLLL